MLLIFISAVTQIFVKYLDQIISRLVYIIFNAFQSLDIRFIMCFLVEKWDRKNNKFVSDGVFPKDLFYERI